MTRLGDVASAQSGIGFPVEHQGQQNGDYPLAKVSDISIAVELNNGHLSTAVNWVTKDVAQQLNASVFPSGSVLFAKIGEAIRLNRRGFATRALLADNNVMGLIPNQKLLHPNYLYYFMMTVDLNRYAQTTAVPSIRSSDILNIEIPLPRLDEQMLIAAILEEADYVRRTRRFTQSLSDNFLQEVFIDMFGEPITNPMRWKVHQLGNLLAVPPRLGTMQPARDVGKQLCVRVGEIGNERNVSLHACKYVSLDGAELERFSLQPNDILLARAIGSEDHLGKFSIMQETNRAVVYDSHVMRLRLNQEILSVDFFAQFLQTHGGRARFLEKTRQTAVQFNINSEQIKEVEVPLPPIERQQEFARLVVDYEHTRDQQQESARQSKHLFQTLLYRAFRGEL